MLTTFKMLTDKILIKPVNIQVNVMQRPICSCFFLSVFVKTSVFNHRVTGS